MNILIVTKEPFPRGAAAVNILISYAKGFIENGAEVTVLCLHNSSDSKIIKQYIDTKGCYKGIKYIYLYILPNNNSKIFRKINNIYSILKTKKIINSLYKESKIDVMLLFLNEYNIIKRLKTITDNNKIKFVKYQSEYPFIIKRNDSFSEWYIKNVFKLFDGLIVETDRLRRYFSDKVNGKAKQIIVPPTTIPEDFLKPIKKCEDIGDYIFYGGSLSLSKKDGVHILIKAFHKLSQKVENINLVISGFGPKEDITYYNDLIDSLEVKNKIIFKLNIARKEMINLMRNAKILALAKETNEIQSGGVSSKIVEYLYTGIPIVMTDLGEITNHLIDNVVVFKSKPDCVDSFAEKLIYVLDNYEEAVKVGRQGKEFALKYFDYKRHGQRMLNFFEEIR